MLNIYRLLNKRFTRFIWITIVFIYENRTEKNVAILFLNRLRRRPIDLYVCCT